MKRSSTSRKPHRRSYAIGITPAIFRRAAILIEIGQETFACCALDRASREQGIDFHRDSPSCLWFERVLKPETGKEAWYGWSEDDATQIARSLGLLLCAILLEEGFEP